MERKKLAIATFGCKLNRYDSEVIRERFEAEGWRVVPFDSDADAWVINTCAVTGESGRQCRQAVRRAARLRRGPEARVIVTGCCAQTSPEEIERMAGGVDLIVGNNDKERIVELLSKCNGSTARVVSGVFDEREFRSLPLKRFGDNTRAFLRIQEGCDRRCSYCVIPRARGRSRSEAPAAALEQARRFAAEGYREIVLCGVHIGDYGRGLDEKASLAALLRELHEVDGIGRIRLSSLDPSEFTPELIETVTSLPKICPHFHVALQSGDDEILRLMRRPYKAADFTALVETLLDRSPDAAIATDVIAGFPGEDEASFDRTFRFLESLPLASMHVFRFSPRPGTPAAGMPGGATEKAKIERSKKIVRLRDEKNLAFRVRFTGRRLEVLVENRRWKKTGLLTGLTGNYIRAFFPGGDELFGEFAAFDAEEIFDGGLRGAIWNI